MTRYRTLQCSGYLSRLTFLISRFSFRGSVHPSSFFLLEWVSHPCKQRFQRKELYLQILIPFDVCRLQMGADHIILPARVQDPKTRHGGGLKCFRPALADLRTGICLAALFAFTLYGDGRPAPGRKNEIHLIPPLIPPVPDLPHLPTCMHLIQYQMLP